jgi:LytR cell envelope-related transcriptional attenuator
MGGRDLAPRRRQTRLRWSALLAILVVLAALGYAGDRYVWPHLKSSPAATSAAPCPAATHPLPLPAAKNISLRVRNSTVREGLASRVASALHSRGFHVHGVGNTSVKVTGSATVRYSPDRAQQAKSLATQLSQPLLSEIGGKRVLDLDLGPKWHGLATAKAARAAERTALKQERLAARPSATCSATPAASSG